MELDGHPTQDVLEELERRGATVYPGDASGPDTASIRLAQQRGRSGPGVWIFLPAEAYETEIDDAPPSPT